MTTEKRPSSYDRMRDAMEREFRRYPQAAMERAFGLARDGAYLYVDFAGRCHRIGRETGRVEFREAGWRHADYNASTTLFDVLSRAEAAPRCSGQFVSLSAVGGQVLGAGPGGDLFAPQARAFAGRCGALRDACARLGGRPMPVGDVSYQLPLLPFLPVVLQFWDADEEFPAQLKLMWDANILDFMHYETTFFAAAHLFQRLAALGGVAL